MSINFDINSKNLTVAFNYNWQYYGLFAITIAFKVNSVDNPFHPYYQNYQILTSTPCVSSLPTVYFRPTFEAKFCFAYNDFIRPNGEISSNYQ